LTWLARKWGEQTRFIELAGEINTHMPNYVISQQAQQFLTKFGRLPTRKDVKPNPEDALVDLPKFKIYPKLLDGEEDRKWAKVFDEVLKKR